MIESVLCVSSGCRGCFKILGEETNSFRSACGVCEVIDSPLKLCICCLLSLCGLDTRGLLTLCAVHKNQQFNRHYNFNTFCWLQNHLDSINCLHKLFCVAFYNLDLKKCLSSNFYLNFTPIAIILDILLSGKTPSSIQFLHFLAALLPWEQQIDQCTPQQPQQTRMHCSYREHYTKHVFHLGSMN